MEELPDVHFDLSMLEEEPSMLEEEPFLLEEWMSNPIVNDYSMAGSASSDAESRSSAVSSPALSEEGANFVYPVKDQELLKLSVKDLNNLVRNLPKDAVKQIKRRRRTLKNRGYAYQCRQKRLEEKSKLETSKDMLERNYTTMVEQLKRLTAERDQYKHQCESLCRLVLAHRNSEPIGKM